MSRVFRLLFFLSAAATLAIIATAAAASAAPVAAAEAAPPVARPLPGCSAVLSAAVAAADLEVAAAARARNNASGSSDSSTSTSSAAPYSKTLLSNGDFLLETHWQTWECMNGIRARSFLTLRPFPAAARERDDEGKGNDGDSDLHCSTVDAGIEIDDRAFRESELPSVAQVDECRPRFCVGGASSSSSSSKGKSSNNNTVAGAGTVEHACEGPYLRTYLDFPALGSPFASFRAIQPHRYCFEPGTGEEGGERNTSRIRWSRFLFFDAEPECGSVSHSTIFAPRSYAPPQKEAEALNPLCRHDERPGSVFVSTYERALARGEGHGAAVAEAAETGALLARHARERAEGSRAFLKAAAEKRSASQGEVSETNSDPVRWSEQLHAVVEVVEHAMG